MLAYYHLALQVFLGAMLIVWLGWLLVRGGHKANHSRADVLITLGLEISFMFLSFGCIMSAPTTVLLLVSIWQSTIWWAHGMDNILTGVTPK